MYLLVLIVVFFTTRYKIIKDNSTLSGRGAVKQWQYFGAMDDLFDGDPTVVPLALVSSLPMGTLQLINVVLTSYEKQDALLITVYYLQPLPQFE